MKNVRYVGEIISPDEEVLLSAVQLNLEANTHKISNEVHHSAVDRDEPEMTKKRKKVQRQRQMANTHKIPNEVHHNAVARDEQADVNAI